LIDSLKDEFEDYYIEDEEDDLFGSVWMPVIADNKQEAE
jgi:hypothetical protein